MAERRLVAVVAGLVLVVAGCTSEPTTSGRGSEGSATRSIASDETNLAVSTTTSSVAAAASSLATSSTTATTAAAAVADKQHHLVWSGVYLGIWDGQSWSGPAEVYDDGWMLPSDVSLFPTDGGPSFVAVAANDPCASVDYEGKVGAVTDLDWDPIPRSAEEVPAASAHTAAVRRALVADGLASPVEGVVRVIRVDLQGDGIDEVIIEGAMEAGEPYSASRPGDHSLVMLRRVENDEVIETALYVSATTQSEADEAGPWEVDQTLSAVPVVASQIGGIVDLNGDGTMELIVERRGDHSAWIDVFDITQTLDEPVLSVGCGW